MGLLAWSKLGGAQRKNQEQQVDLIPKIERNLQRDREVNTALAAMGYTIFRIWDHEVKKNFIIAGVVIAHLEAMVSKN